jgi:hypothetical protein
VNKLVVEANEESEKIKKNKSTGFWGWVKSWFSDDDVTKLKDFVKGNASYKEFDTNIKKLKEI